MQIWCARFPGVGLGLRCSVSAAFGVGPNQVAGTRYPVPGGRCLEPGTGYFGSAFRLPVGGSSAKIPMT